MDTRGGAAATGGRARGGRGRGRVEAGRWQSWPRRYAGRPVAPKMGRAACGASTAPGGRLRRGWYGAHPGGGGEIFSRRAGFF